MVGRKSGIKLSAVLAMVLASSSAFAQQGADVETLLQRGIALRTAGHDDEALAEFRRAYALTQSPLTSGQLGLVEQSVGNWVVAEGHLRVALAARGDPWVERNRVALQSAYNVISQHVGTLEIQGSPVGARVRIDGDPVGVLPLAEPIRLLAGAVVIDVQAEGFYGLSHRVVITANALARERVNLRQLDVATEASASPSPPEPVRASSGSPRPASSEAVPPQPPRRAGPPVVSYVLGTASLACFAGGAVALIIFQIAAASYDDPANRCLEGTRYGLLSAQCRGYFDTGTATAPTSVVALSLGGALAVGAIASYLLAPGPQRAAARLTCAPGLGLASATCEVRF